MSPEHKKLAWPGRTFHMSEMAYTMYTYNAHIVFPSCIHVQSIRISFPTFDVIQMLLQNYIYIHGTPAKRPKTKHSSYKTSPIQNFPRHYVPASKRLNYKTSQLHNDPSLKTSSSLKHPFLITFQLQNVPTTKRSSYKMS
jgi:hypothetical protein